MAGLYVFLMVFSHHPSCNNPGLYAVCIPIKTMPLFILSQSLRSPKKALKGEDKANWGTLA